MRRFAVEEKQRKEEHASFFFCRDAKIRWRHKNLYFCANNDIFLYKYSTDNTVFYFCSVFGIFWKQQINDYDELIELTITLMHGSSVSTLT